jgi:hypothetical protein
MGKIRVGGEALFYAGIVLLASASAGYLMLNYTGGHVPQFMEQESYLCPMKCYRYSAGGPGNEVDVNCEVARKYVHRSLQTCGGIESYTSTREIVCSCNPVKVVGESCPRQCGSGDVCAVDPAVVHKSNLPCEGRTVNSTSVCRCELGDGEWAYRR